MSSRPTHAMRLARQAFRKTRPSQLPYICASCQHRAIFNSSRPSIILPRAQIWSISHHQQIRTNTSVSAKETALPKTFYDLFPETFPNGPPPKSPFTPDQKRLRKEFLQLQSKAHPDLASGDKKRSAEAISSRINEAYRTLQDPLKRAQYLLAHQGIDVENESAKLAENELLMEVMEAREAVDDVENEEDLVEIRAENNGRIEKSVSMLEDCFATGDLEKAAEEAVRLRYWMNIDESIHGWEKGSGGGMIHH